MPSRYVRGDGWSSGEIPTFLWRVALFFLDVIRALGVSAGRYRLRVVRIRVFGPLEIELEGGPGALPPSRRGRALLAWLGLHPGRHARSKVAAVFWPDVLDTSARTSLRGAIAELRRTLGAAAAALTTTRETIELGEAATIWVDVREFGALVAAGRRREALDLVRGPVLADLDDEWIDAIRDEYVRHELRLLDELAAQYATTGAVHDAIGLARRRVQLDPLSEPAGRTLVRLLAAAGDRAGALDAAAALSDRLHRDLGLGPDPETLRLVAEVRSQAGDAPDPAPIPVPVPRSVSGLDATPIGRDAPLVQIRRVRHAPETHGGPVVLISGDAGIGKTTLALTAASEAAADGVAILVGRCDEEGIVPFGPWVEALGPALDQLTDHELVRLAQNGGLALARLFPRLRERLPSVAVSQAEPDTERWQLFEAVATLLHELSSAGALLVLDDVQWADRSTLLLLRHVLRTHRSDQLTVLLTCRTTDLPDGSFLPVLLAELRRDRKLTAIELAGLAETDVAEMVGRRRGGAPERAFVRALHQETEGNPFFVEEILRSIPRSSAHHDDSTTSDIGFAVPQGVHDVVRRRLARLPQEVGDILTVASVLGRDFDLGLLGTVSGRPQDDLLDSLDQAVAAGVVQEAAVGRYTFGHALFRSSLYDGLTLTRRARLHLAVAEAIAANTDGGPSRSGEVAHHYLSAANPELLAQTVEHARTAYTEAIDQLAYEEAITIARRCVAALDAAADTASAQHGDQVASDLPVMLLALGEGAARAGDVQAARAAFGRAADLAAWLGDGQLFATAALGFAGPSWRSFGEVDQDAVLLLEDALRRLGDDERALRISVQARLAIKLYFARSGERMSSLTATALAGARELGDPDVLAAALEARLWAAWHPDGVLERLDLALELLQVAQRHGMGETAAVARRWRVVALLEAGRMNEARAEAAHHAELARTLRLPYELMYTAVFAAMRALAEGRLDDAERESVHVAAFGELRGGADAIQFVGVHRVTIALLRGEFGELADVIGEFADRYPALSAWRAGHAYALAEAGRVDEARALLDRVWPPEHTLARDAVWLPAVALLGLTAARLRDTERAAHLYRLLAPYARRPIVLGAGGAIWASTDLYLGLLAAIVGDAAGADIHFTETASWLSAVGAAPWLALIDAAREATGVAPGSPQPA